VHVETPTEAAEVQPAAQAVQDAPSAEKEPAAQEITQADAEVCPESPLVVKPDGQAMQLIWSAAEYESFGQLTTNAVSKLTTYGAVLVATKR